MFRPDPEAFDKRRSRSVEGIERASSNATSGTAVIISTRGRPQIVRSLVRQLAQQTRRPEHVFVVAAEPNDIAERYQRALQTYLVELRQVVLESAIDYHQVMLNDDYEQVLMRFLVGRARMKSSR